MVKIIDGKILAEKVKDEVVKEIIELNHGQTAGVTIRPNLAIVLVGEREDSKLYVSLKEKEAKKVGIDTHLYKCDQGISEHELLEMIKCLNEDESIDAILVQLPLPATIDADTIILAVDPAKDVDGFQPDNLAKLLKGCPSRSPRFAGEAGPARAEADDADVLMPPVFAAALAILESIKYELEHKSVCLISRAEVFGQALAQVLKCRGAQVQAVKVDDEQLKEKTKRAEVLITAVGQPHFIKKDMVKEGAVVIDIGITKQGRRVVGDVDFNDVKDKAGYLTPVPGGVGPLTVAMAFKNTVELYKRRHDPQIYKSATNITNTYNANT